MIREFYSNLFIYHEDSGGHYLTSWIRGNEFSITKLVVSKALGVPLVCKPTYSYTEFLPMDSIMSLLCGRSVSWGSERRINSCEFTEFNYLYLRISCHNIYPIYYIHTILIDRCTFLYALITDGSMCFPSLSIQTIVDIYRSKSKAQKLFFLICMYIYIYIYIYIEGVELSRVIQISSSRVSSYHCSYRSHFSQAVIGSDEEC